MSARQASSITRTRAFRARIVTSCGESVMKNLGFVLTGLLAVGSAASAASLQRGPAATVARGAPLALGAQAIAQMNDNTPVATGGVSCSDYENRVTYASSWWRRYYLAEHGAPSSVRIQSVTVGTETGSAPVSIRLYTIPHATTVDTIALEQLRQIGTSATVMVHGNLDTATIAVEGLVADAVGHDLVVEFHTDGNAGSAFYAGGNASSETHPSFLSAPACGAPEPARVGDVNFPDAHMIIVANAAPAGVGVAQSFTPATVAAGTSSRLDIALANPFATTATLTSAFTHVLPAGLVVAAQPNAVSSCGGSIDAAVGSGMLILTGGAIPAAGHCSLGVDVSSAGGQFESVIAIGALATSQGSNTQSARASLSVVPKGGNGLVHSGPLNRVLAMTGIGTSYDMVRSAFTDTGAVDANWDVRFGLGMNALSPAVITLAFNTNQASEFVVDPSGSVALLGNGDVVGPAAQFAGGSAVPIAPAWLENADAAVGVRFRCSDRLPYPVATGDYCYGYLRLSTTSPAGVPARIVESAFQGDGDPITVQLTAAANPPSASVMPASIALSVAANAISRQQFALANAVGSLPLRYAAGGRGEALAARPAPEDIVRRDPAAQSPASRLPSQPSSPLRVTPVHGYAAAPWSATEGFMYALDDGVYEMAVGFGTEAGIWLNRYSLIEAQTINSVSILWPKPPEGGSTVGLPVNLVAYYDADADGNPVNSVRLGGDHVVSIGALDTFETYPTDFVVPGPGDVYIGMVEHWAMNGYPYPLPAVALDSTTYRAASYVSLNFPDPNTPPHLNLDDLSANQATALLGALGLGGNFTFRATGTGASCSGPAVPWLRVEGNSDVVVGGAAAAIRFSVDPAAGQLEPGNHSAELCVLTNDPAQRTLSVPINVQVTAALAAHACSTVGDSLFCSGFDGDIADPIVRSGLLAVNLPATFEGMSFNFARGDWSESPMYGDDFNPYQPALPPYLMFYWHGAEAPGRNGGVADTLFGPYRVLQSGDTIGPDSVFSEIASSAYAETASFLAGVDGYLGIQFYNEETRQTNYGYVHLLTTWPTGYPAMLVGYGYNRAGGPITVP